MWDEQNEKQNDNIILMKNDQENTSLKNQAHFDICKEMIDALKIENEALHSNLSQIIEKKQSQRH